MKKNLILSLVLLFLLTSVMVISVVTSLAQDGETTTTAVDDDALYFAQNCNLASGDETIAKNKYIHSKLSAEGAMKLYHKTINEKFNEYIRKMMSEEDPKNGQPPEDDNCENTDNYSTYCVAMDLLNNPEYGYMAYNKALTCRKYSLFDDATDRDAWTAYSDAVVIDDLGPLGENNEERVQNIYQAQRVLQISARLEGIENEIDAAKQTLDQALSAYDSLKTAWKMHVKYMEIYESLVKYRDKLVEVRHQVEFFPAKFIDATTTSCT